MKEISLLYPEGYEPVKQDMLTEFEFIDNLGIRNLIRLNKSQWNNGMHLELQDYFTTNPDVIAYRMDVVSDMVENTELYNLFKELLPFFRDIYETKKEKDFHSDMESSLYSIKEIELYIKVIDELKNSLTNIPTKSLGIDKVKQKVQDIAQSKEYSDLKQEVGKLATEIRGIRSITIGINIDGQFRPIDAGIISVNKAACRSGNIFDRLLKKDHYQNNLTCLSPLIPFYTGVGQDRQVAVSVSILNALNEIYAKAVRSWKPVIRQYFINHTDFLAYLYEDIQFLTSAVDLIMELKKNGYPVCKPVIGKREDKEGTLKGLYNPVVAMDMSGSPIILNDFTFDSKGMLYIVTGPNMGGKSVFANAVGIIQALFQLGLYVPAQESKISPVDNIYTHFPVTNDENIGKGRFGEECERLSEILDIITEYDMILIDEALSNTSGTEASYIASEIMKGLSIIGCRGMFVTHIHELAQKTEEYNSQSLSKSKVDNLSAQMADKNNGSRSFRLERITPDGLSYARDIAKQYGLTLENIISKRDIAMGK
jgi:DNA mismatch repair ATPase MutS